MIVSASVRTDIPAFHAEWFLNRLAAGFAMVRNPFGGVPYRVGLTPDEVDAFVLWTRNPAPLLREAARIRAVAPVLVQMTILGYPRALDRSVPDLATQIGAARAVVAAFGPGALGWRYDPIVLTDLTPPAWHVAQVARIAAALAGLTDACVTSFVTPYAKTRRALAGAARAAPLGWRVPAAPEAAALVAQLAEATGRHGIELALCTQPDLAATGVAPAAACIDGARLASLGAPTADARRRGTRPGCLCAESRDLGAYDSCAHGCRYCYAVGDQRRAVRRVAAQDPTADRLG